MHTKPHSQRAAALVVVLAFLVILTVMIIAFFSSVTSESGASTNQADAMDARQLADSTLQYVSSQIRQATTGGTSTTWASQPGMIRTYGDDGNAKQAFKLYSSSNMVTTIANNTYNPSNDLPPNSWASDQAVWTDLNAPVTTTAANIVFPIIDPRAAAKPSGKNDPMVEGFSIDAATVAGTVAPTSTTDTTARLPMPVRWLYLLRDGRFTAPSGGSADKADFSGSDPKPTAENPIVGRVAFWTDDETCKLNLNTAVGGVPWDNPTYIAGIDLNFSRYKPVKNEFARYPGHPATTSLVPVLWSFSDLPSPNYNLFPNLSPSFPYKFYHPNVNSAADVQRADVNPSLTAISSNYFSKSLALNPRNELGGSRMGSSATIVEPSATIPAQPLDSDRLFASVDEALFAQPSAATTPRPNNVFALNPSDVEKLRFFLTTQSRAPDINPLNQPKVGIWPIPETATKRTPIDRLIAFCSTLNGNAYYFTRNNAGSPTADFLPGSRNDQLFDYLERSMSQAIPGFGGSLQSRYQTTGLRRILTLVYDYIRSSVNLIDTYAWASGGGYNFTPATGNGLGQVVPIKITKGGADYKGLGRFVTIKQAGLHFIAVAANQPPCIVDPTTGIPTTAPNPMHPWCGNMPAAVPVNNNGDGTWDINGGATSYPVIGNQTHAGLPYLTTKWIRDPNILTGTTPANVALRATVINPRYQGPSAIYGAGAGAGAANSQALPEPWPTTAPGKLGPHQTLIQALFFIDPVIVNPGHPPYLGKYQVRVTGLNNFTADGSTLGFRPDAVHVASDVGGATPDYNAGYWTISSHFRTSGGLVRRRLRFESQRVVVGPGANNGSTFNFGGGTITVEIRTEPTAGDPTSPANLGQLIQTYQIEIPSAIFPTPLLPPMPAQGSQKGTDGLISLVPGSTINYVATVGYNTAGRPTNVAALTPSSMLSFDSSDSLASNPNFGVGSTLYNTGRSRYSYGTGAGNDLFYANFILSERMTDPQTDARAKLSADTVRSVELLYGDARVVGTQTVVGTNFFRPHQFYNDLSMRAAHTLRSGGANAAAFGPLGANVRGATDHMISASSTASPNFTYTTNGITRNNYRGYPIGAGINVNIQKLGANQVMNAINSDASIIRSEFPNVTSSVDFFDNSFLTTWNNGGDYDTGSGTTLDGPFINKPNEGGQMRSTVTYDAYNANPDFYTIYEVSAENLQNAPNRQVPSPVIFGSLPVGDTPQTSWRTLLFSPNPNSITHLSLSEVPAAGDKPTAGTAPDYLFLDFFNMPIVEPYAISEPFSTAGRVNMNYQMAPFTNIRRDTALRGVLRSGLLNAAEDSKVSNRKSLYGFQGEYSDGNTGPYTQFLQNTGHWAFRYPIHIEETLKQFQQRFGNGDIFRAPSEICSLWLYPAKQPTASSPENPATALVNWDANSTAIKAWWYNNPGGTAKTVTGDNMRERPYASIYPRLTTKSNTYTVYMKVQALQKSSGSSPVEWVENRDQVRSEYAGSAIIERYIDANDANIPDFTQTANASKSLDDYYRYRVLNQKRFAP